MFHKMRSKLCVFFTGKIRENTHSSPSPGNILKGNTKGHKPKFVMSMSAGHKKTQVSNSVCSVSFYILVLRSR